MNNGDDRISAISPDIMESVERLKALALQNPERQAAADRAIAKEKIAVLTSIETIKKDLSKIVPLQEQLTFSFLPSEMTRISPFFPMSKTEMGHRPLEKQTFQNSWGTMEIQGERLAIFDESILLAVLRLAKVKKSFTFSTTINEILRITGSSAARDTYNAVGASLDRLTGTKITLTIKTKDGNKKRFFNTILSGGIADKYNMQISINEYFGAMYLEGLITSIDIDFRASLRGDITKAMYRFYEGQPGHYEIHMDKLCEAVNLDKTQQKFELRKKINKSLKELISHGYFEYGKINKKDHVVTKKSSQNSVKKIK